MDNVATVSLSVTPPVPEFNFRAVAPVALPMVMVLAATPVPTFMGSALASLPMLMAPPEELMEKTPVESKSTVVAAVRVVAPVPPRANEAVPSVRVRAFTEVTVTAKASTVTAVLSAEPNARVPEPWGSMVMLELLPEVVMFMAPADATSMIPADVMSIPPALAVNCKAAFPEPADVICMMVSASMSSCPSADE